MNKIEAFATRMVDAIKAYVARELSALAERITNLEARASIPGERGADGERGEKGEAGLRGERGDPGERGEKGDKGDPGERGEAGSVGERGEKGERGEPGLRGDPGPAGKDGAAGDRGADGAKGDPGIDGGDGAAGVDGAPGREGKDGRDGRDGKDGAPGRDALDLDILPSIDESKSYARGTWASHCGGLIRAARETQAVADGDLVAAGWVVMVEGLAAVVVTQSENQREFQVATMNTSGAKAISDFTVPVLIYREIWREGEFARGDVVTWGGSAWHCQETTTEKPGGTSKAWKLMVKEGRPGKDGERGADGKAAK